MAAKKKAASKANAKKAPNGKDHGEVSADAPNKPIVGEPAPEKHPNLKEPWKPGQSGNPAGRPKGSRNKIADEFFNDFYADWLKHGADAIAWTRTNKPDVYFKGAIAVLPREINMRMGDYDALTEDALDEEINRLRRDLSAVMNVLSPTTRAN